MLSNSKIDAIGDGLRNGLHDETCLRSLEEFRSTFLPAYGFVQDILSRHLRLNVSGRPSKSTISIIEKLRRQKIRLSQMQDVSGCRVLVGNLLEQDVMIRVIETMIGSAVIDDKRQDPTNGYRAVHIISKGFGRAIEIQLRTRLQHLWAELSEEISVSHGKEIKYGVGDARALSYLNELSSLIARLENNASERAKFLHGLKYGRENKIMHAQRKNFSRIETDLIRGIKKVLKTDIGPG